MTWRDHLRLSIRTEMPTQPAPAPAMPAAIAPPSRGNTPVGVRESMAVPAMFRALQVLATSGSQLAVDVERNGERLRSDQVPSIVTKPHLDMARSDWVEMAIMSLAAAGKLFVHAPRTPGSPALELDILPPHHVHIKTKNRRITGYAFDGRDYGPDEILYAPLLRVPGDPHGYGPIQAAQAGLTTVRGMQDYMGRWFADGGQPAGLLSSDQTLTQAEARTMRQLWNGLDEHGQPTAADNPSRIKVLGKGLHYEPIILSPRDAMWLDAQEFSRLEIALLMGVPGSLMMVAPEGGSRSYQNVEQEWIGFTRFTLTWYLRKLENIWTAATVRGQTVRFRLDSLLRSDTLTRYQAHEISLRNQWETPAGVRAIENLPPHPDIPDTPITTTPTAQEATP